MFATMKSKKKMTRQCGDVFMLQRSAEENVKLSRRTNYKLC